MKNIFMYLLLGIFSITIAVNVFIFFKKRNSPVAAAAATADAPVVVPVTEIKVVRSLIDIGKVKKNEPAEGIFQIVNTGKAPLMIGEMVADCHCTVAVTDKKVITPRDTAFIRVSYDSKIPGFFQRNVTLNLNAASSPMLLVIRGQII